jgi:hypothetical protein
MNDHGNETEIGNHALAIAVWDNEGGALGQSSMDHHYGRRIESDRSWSVYHVFSGIPADAGGRSMTGLNRSDATEGMLSLNRRNEERRRERNRLMESGSVVLEIDEVRQP